MNYEILYIIPAKYSDSEIEEVNKKIPPILEEAGASIIKIDNWGKKKLAYQIKHFRYGYYTLIVFSAPAEALEKITRKLNLNQEIIRFQIVKEIEWTGPKPSDKKKEEKNETEDKKENKGDEKKEKIEKVEKEEVEEKVEEVKEKDNSENTKEEEKDAPKEKAEEKKEEKLMEKKEEKPKKEKKKASIDDLDKKLDELLSDAS